MTTNNSVNTYIVPTTANEVTTPSQPAFLAYNSASDLNVTGNGTVYTIVCDTEVFDQNADYNNGTGVFTAPVSGRYLFWGSVLINGLVNATNFTFKINTTGRIFGRFIGRSALAADLTQQQSCVGYMNASDTAFLTIQVFGEGADTADVYGGATLYTYFGGLLAT